MTLPQAPPSTFPWIFSARVDLATFLGSALLALGLLVLGDWAGWLERDTPDWMWIAAVLMIDVAHVYATGIRVYFDAQERQRRPWLYGLLPLLAFLIGWAIYSESASLFWRGLAYLAVFHFIRQQYGWVALYRARGGERDRFGLLVDSLAIYLATIYPLVYWHTHPRRFSWFVATDFVTLPPVWESLLAPCYWAALSLYAARSLYRGLSHGRWNPGKDVVVGTTAVCWYLGIVSYNSDYAFTVTNVITHGVPYIVLVYWFREQNSPSEIDRRPVWQGARWLRYVGLLWVFAYMEELLWDCGVWHERPWLFGGAWNTEGILEVLVPLLAVPQITHYVLDGFIWKRRSNPQFNEHCCEAMTAGPPPDGRVGR